jgi:hypothetical protein
MCRRQMCSNRQCGVSLVRPFGIGYPDSDRPPAAEIPPKPIRNCPLRRFRNMFRNRGHRKG